MFTDAILFDTNSQLTSAGYKSILTNLITAIPQELRKSWNILFSPATRQG
jgi:hypothetical protein